MAVRKSVTSELISIQWSSSNREEGLLEGIKAGIAVIWTGTPVPIGERLSVDYMGSDFNGCVLTSAAEDDGYITKILLYERSVPRRSHSYR